MSASSRSSEPHTPICAALSAEITETCNDKHLMYNDTPIKQKGTPTGNAVSISLTVLLSGTGKNNESEKRYF